MPFFMDPGRNPSHFFSKWGADQGCSGGLAPSVTGSIKHKGTIVALISIEELVEAGVHFGHQSRLWNPKMKPFIFAKKNLIHIIDLKQTIRGFLRARHFLGRLASSGAQILVVGTKKQLRELVASESKRADQPFVIERWIGGTLTNYNTIRKRLDHLIHLEELEENGQMERFSKKQQSRLRREMRKIRRNLDGIRNLKGLPGCVLVIDPKREEIAVKEAAKMNVPVVAILDTDCDPKMIDIPIPANDDALRSVQVLLSKLMDAVITGKANMDENAPRFRSEIPELSGRSPRRGGGGRGGSGGRYPSRPTGGRADTVSFGRPTDEEESKAKAGEAAKAAEASEAPASGAPAPEAKAPETPPTPPTPESTEPKSAPGNAPEGEEKKDS
jgi:small subunit ribosomal protein S2